jgi:hypothetical protein
MVADLLPLDQEEFSGNREPGDDFIEPLEPDFEPPLFTRTLIDPSLWKFGTEAIEGDLAAPILHRVDPAFVIEQRVMIGEAEEIVPVFFVPQGDTLRVRIAVAPERMRMQVAAIPLEFPIGGENVLAGWFRNRSLPQQQEPAHQEGGRSANEFSIRCGHSVARQALAYRLLT